MSSKLFGLFVFGVLAVLLVAGLANAAVIFSDDFNDGDLVGWTIVDGSTTVGTPWTNTGTFAEAKPGDNNVDGTSNLSRTISTSGYDTIIVRYDRKLGDFETDDEFTVSWSVDGATFTPLEETLISTPSDASFVSKTFNLPVSVNNNSNFQLKFDCLTDAQTGEFCQVDNVAVEGTAVSTTPPEIPSLCTNPSPQGLEVKKIDFTNNGMQLKEFGEDDEWFLLEEIDVEIEVENDGNNDVDDVSIEWGLWDTRNSQWVVDFDEADEVNIKDGDEEVLTVSFTLDDDLDVDLDELDDGDHYRLYVKASGTVDDGLDTPTCAADFEPATIVIESDFVVLDNFESPETVSCGANVEVTANAWNIGDRDQDEVSVRVFNSELGLDDEILVGDMDAFDNQRISFTFAVPRDAQEKTYGIRLQVEDEDGDIYENDFNDDLSDFTLLLNVAGGCTGTVAPVTITANLVSGGKAGQDLVVRATVANTGASSATYTLAAAGQGQWASSYTVVPSTLTLAAGQSGEATYTFKVNSDASGEQTFNIELVSGNQVTTQPVSVMIERAGFFSSITGGAVSDDNAWVWGLGALNILLIIVIIFVAMRVMRK